MKFDVLVEEVLTELFNTDKNLEWTEFTSGPVKYQTSFKAPNKMKYYISLIKLNQYHGKNKEDVSRKFKGPKKAFHSFWDSAHSYAVEFIDKNDSIEVTGSGSAAYVFGSVINALKGVLKEVPNDIKNLYFFANEPSRASLYDRIAPSLAKAFNFKLAISKEKDGTHYFLSKATM